MQISNVLPGYSDPAALGKRGEATESVGGRIAAAVDNALSPANKPQAELADILSKYDVTDISPMEFTEMIQKLFEAGAISETELQQLAAVRHDLETEGVDPDESIDLLEFYVEKIEKLQRRRDDSDGLPGSHQQLGPMLRRLDWIEKFALIQSAPDAIGLDALA